MSEYIVDDNRPIIFFQTNFVRVMETEIRLFDFTELSVIFERLSPRVKLVARNQLRTQTDFITSAFGVHLFDVADPAGADRVHGLHGYRVLGAALQPVDGVREPVRIHVHPLQLVAAYCPISKHVGGGHSVRLFHRFPLDEYGAGRDGVHVEFGWRRRVEHVHRVRYLIPAEYVLHVTRVIAPVRLVVHRTDRQATVGQDP